MAERKQPIEDRLVSINLPGPYRTDSSSRKIGHKRGQRLPVGSYPSRSRGHSEVTHRICPTLLRLLATAQITNAVAGRLPLSAQRPSHPEVLVTQDPSAKPPSRPAEGVSSSQSLLTVAHWFVLEQEFPPVDGEDTEHSGVRMLRASLGHA